MKNSRGVLFLAGLTLFSLSCVKSTGPVYSELVAYQVPGCRGSAGKVPSADSCFSYRFDEILFVDLCARGNCCPDSNRFLIRTAVRQDTIVATVADTAAQSCRCMCEYSLHFELTDLPFPSYLFICMQGGDSGKDTLYTERVYRHRI